MKDNIFCQLIKESYKYKDKINNKTKVIYATYLIYEILILCLSENEEEEDKYIVVYESKPYKENNIHVVCFKYEILQMITSADKFKIVNHQTISTDGCENKTYIIIDGLQIPIKKMKIAKSNIISILKIFTRQRYVTIWNRANDFNTINVSIQKHKKLISSIEEREINHEDIIILNEIK